MQLHRALFSEGPCVWLNALRYFLEIHKLMKDLQREGEGGGGVGRGKGRESKEVRRGRERKRTMFA